MSEKKSIIAKLDHIVMRVDISEHDKIVAIRILKNELGEVNGNI